MFSVKLFMPVILVISASALRAQNTYQLVRTDTLGDDHTLEEVIVNRHKNKYKVEKPSSSLRLEGNLLKIPQNIQVLNSQLLGDQQIYSMSDAIARNVSGAARIEEWGDMYTYITMRGTRAASFRNGMNTAWMYGILSEDMSFVDRIEFVKGPAGFMMSNGEPSGIYNVVTKEPTGQNRGNISLGLGSYGLYRTSLDLDGVMNKNHSLLYRLNVSAQSNNSFREYESTRRINIAPVLQYRIDDKTTLTLEYILQRAKLPDLGIGYLFSKTGYGTIDRKKTLADPGIESTKINDQNITANLEHSFNENWKLTAQLSYFDYDQKGSFIWVKSIDDIGNTQRIHYIWDAKNEMTFGQAFVNGKFRTGKLKHTLLGGVDFSNKSYVADFNQSNLLDSIGSFNIHRDYYQKPYYGIGKFDRTIPLKERVGTGFLLESRIASIYLQDELPFFSDRLHLTLAGRYTYVKDNNYGAVSENKRFTPRAGLSYSLNKYTNVYALYDQTFVPQTGKLRDGGQIKPLTGNNMELGFKKDWLKGKWNTTLSLYRIMKDNQVSNDPDNAGGENYVLQFGQTKTQGIEFDLKGEIFQGMNLMANYAFTESKITRSTNKYEKGMLVPGYAKHNINTWLNYRIREGVLNNFAMSTGLTYMLDRATWWNGNYEGESLPDYFRLDGAVSWASEKLSIHLNIYNILDKYLYNGAHHSSGWYYWRPEAPRNFRLNITYNF
ncbi:MAG: TonB-dependent siderophore receptor [Sphingobacterium sp.]|jgi:iron complex outermembrane receptor protein|nr:TonB-dependent siderophore receptor [Sphingobacterium sp.]